MNEDELRKFVDLIFKFAVSRIKNPHVANFLTPLFYAVNVEIDGVGIPALIEYLKANGFEELFTPQED